MTNSCTLITDGCWSAPTVEASWRNRCRICSSQPMDSRSTLTATVWFQFEDGRPVDDVMPPVPITSSRR